MRYKIEDIKKIVSKYINVTSIEYIGEGNHCQAFCINDIVVVKMPKNQKASLCLKTEMQVLGALKGKFDVQIPNVLFSGEYTFNAQNLCFYASTKLSGKKLDKKTFSKLPLDIKLKNADIIAKFLHTLHNQKNVFVLPKKNLAVLHGDFSLNHILFDDENIVCGILDFADAKVGKISTDFMYLLDDQDDEEFGLDFGEMVQRIYNTYEIEKN